MASAMLLNTCQVMVFWADRSNEGLKSMGLNFTRTWMNFFFTGTKIQIGEFYKDQKHHLPFFFYTSKFSVFIYNNNFNTRQVIINDMETNK
jgi:hypothetical protein